MNSIKDAALECGITNYKSSLVKDYKEALKDERFKELVSKLNASEDTLMKYTSFLEESACEYANCKNCKNIFECKNKVKGHAYLPRIEGKRIAFNYKACKYQEKILKDNAFKKNITLYQTPVGILDANIKEIYSKDATRYEVIEYLLKFIDEYPNVSKGLYLHGSFGAGKSYLVSAAFSELAKKGYKSTIIFWPEFLRDIKSYFGYDLEYRNMVNKIKNTPLLFIDDIGAENVTAWSRDEILCTILQYRMDNKLCTFFTSNLNIEDLEKHLSITKEGNEIVKARRITERIKQLTIDMELISKNLRK
jgi:primosomal protein DnaI